MPADLPATDDLTPGAVRLLRPPGRFGYVVEFHQSVGSTNDRARARALAGEPAGHAVVADYQSAGRGRLGRRWEAPPGTCLILSVIVRPPPARLAWLAPAAALAVLDAVDSIAPGEAQCKWPNDVVLGGKKVCGILVETVYAGPALRAAVIGIGLNVNLDCSSLGPTATPATSLMTYTGRRQSRLALLDRLLAALERELRLIHEGASPVLRWSERLVTIGRHVEASIGVQRIAGRAAGVDDTGALLIEQADGVVIAVTSGEVTLRAGAE